MPFFARSSTAVAFRSLGRTFQSFSLLDGKHTTRSRDLILRCDSEISSSYFPDFFGDFC